MSVSFSNFPAPFPATGKNIHSVTSDHFVLYGGSATICQRFCGLKLWLLDRLKLKHCSKKHGLSESKIIKNQDKLDSHLETSSSNDGRDSEGVSTFSVPNVTKRPTSKLQAHSPNFPVQSDQAPSLCIAVIGATGELARRKIFPALFALYYSGFLPENVGIVGYSRKNLTDEDLRSIIASTLTCRIDHRENCGDKIDAFLSRTYYLNGGYDNREGMLKLSALMEHIEGGFEANRIFYLSVPQEALLDVASTLAICAQTQKGWNRIIIEKPFGFDALSSHWLTKALLSQFQEKQLYRIDHLLGRNLIENLTVLRFSNLIFEPLWSRTYIRSIQVILSEEMGVQSGRYFDGYGIIRDIVHSHILQTIALLAMEPPISLNGEDIRNEKMSLTSCVLLNLVKGIKASVYQVAAYVNVIVKVLRSICRLEPSNVILGQYKATSDDKIDVKLNSPTPTYFAAVLYIDNARWDGVPFLIKAGMGLIKHRVEIRIQFRHVPGNIYHDRFGHNINLATNELILRDVPDEAILVRVNNKVPGLGLQLDASELNLLYKDKYNAEVPDSYEHLLLDVIDGDNHLFMRSDELTAAWNILNPVLQEIDKNNIAPELYELGGRGPVGAYYLWAKHGVKILRSICRLEPGNVILGQYKATSGDKVDVKLNSLTPTYFAAALYIDNASWDGVPFLIKAGIGLIRHGRSPRKASSPEVPAHTDKSEYVGCFPGANPPTLKSDMKEIGLADDVLVDEQDIPAPVPLLLGSYRTHLLADFCHQTSAHHVCSRNLAVLGRVGLEKAAKEDAEGVEPIVIEEENSPPRAIPADVGEASTPPDAAGDTPLHMRRSSQPMLLGLLICHLLEHISSLGRAADPGTLGFWSRHKQALRLVEPLHALDPGTLGFWSRHKQALRLGEPLHALALRLDEPLHAFNSSGLGFCSPSRGRADPGTLGFCLAIKRALRLDEPLHAFKFFKDWDSARLLVVEQILARLASVSP
ncbi:Inactive glucose-6-phosphate 1-dehydrogenase 4 [Citrus sinensis]|nr:Inactive glucose-6-phosphate 1-dehydrogenase 4 [Citrus sinensis]